MKTNEERRLENLRRIIDDAGTIEAAAKACDTDASYLGQILNRLPDSKTGKPKNVGDRLARKLELRLGKPVGWMDNDHPSPDYLASGATVLTAHAPTARENNDPRRQRLLDAIDDLLDEQIDEVVNNAEETARRNREIETALAARKKNAA